jgi:hypothetical protein
MQRAKSPSPQAKPVTDARHVRQKSAPTPLSPKELGQVAGGVTAPQSPNGRW